MSDAVGWLRRLRYVYKKPYRETGGKELLQLKFFKRLSQDEIGHLIHSFFTNVTEANRFLALEICSFTDIRYTRSFTFEMMFAS